MPTNRELSIRMKLKDQATKKLKSVQARFRRFSASIKKMGATFAKVGIALAVAATAAVFALKRIISTGMTYSLQLDKMAKMTGITAAELARLSYAAKQEHSSMEALEKGLMNLTVRIGYAGDGLATYLRYFNALGIEYRKADGTLRNTHDVFLDIADVVSKGKLSTEKLAAVMQLFGARAAKELIPMLKKGRGWFNEMGKSAEQLGIVLDSKTTASMKKLDDEVTKAKEAWKGVQIQLTIALIPALKEVVELMTKDLKAVVVWAKKLKDNKEAIEGVKKALIEGYKAAQDFIGFLIVGTGEAADAWRNLNASVLWTLIKMKEVARLKNVLTPRAIEPKKYKNKLLQFFFGAETEAEADKAIADVKKYNRKLEDEKDFLNREIKALEEMLGKSLNTGSSGEKLKKMLADFKKAISSIKKELAHVSETGGAGGAGGEENVPEIMKPSFIEKTKQAWLELGDGIRAGLEKANVSFGTFKDATTQGTVSMINSMKTMWSDFIYNSFLGQLDDAQKAFASFGRSVLRIIADIISRWVTMQIITGIGRLFSPAAGAGAGASATGFGATGGGSAASGLKLTMHNGGIIRAHSGMYLAPDEVPVIAQTGEGILSRRGMSTLARLNSGQSEGGGEVNYYFNMTIVANDEKSFRDRLAQNKDIFVNTARDSIERNGLLRGVINKYTKK